MHRMTLRAATVAASVLLLAFVFFCRQGQPNAQVSAAQARGQLVGDGVADDTAALEQLLRASSGNVELPAGLYRISRTIEIRLAEHGPLSMSGAGTARIVMAGSGRAPSIAGTHGGTGWPHTPAPRRLRNARQPRPAGL